jgi:hypothetical protein
MLRVSAGIHDAIPKAVTEKVTEVRQNGTRRIGRVRLLNFFFSVTSHWTLLTFLVDSDAISSLR